MFNRHNAEFITLSTATKVELRTSGASMLISAETRLETPEGFADAKELTAGDCVATLDGGFAQIKAVRMIDQRTESIFIPGGTLGTCTDLLLPADARIVLTPPAGMTQDEAPYVSASAADLAGYRGIRATLGAAPVKLAFDFDEEEVVWAQTGLLIHAQPLGEAFYKSADYGKTRAILALCDHLGCGPDLSSVA